MMIPRILTIGVYGFTSERFVEALEAEGVDLLCDVRQRRGVRGSHYAFANSAQLQELLRQHGIRYRHCKELAPTDEMRELQRKEDARLGIRQSDRDKLGDAFVAAYEDQCLRLFDPTEFLASLGDGTRAIAFMCVEGNPKACHRYLIAQYFERLGADVKHILP